MNLYVRCAAVCLASLAILLLNPEFVGAARDAASKAEIPAAASAVADSSDTMVNTHILVLQP